MSSPLESLTPNELAVLSTVVAISISDGLSADDINSLGNFITAVGSIMLTIAAQQQLLEGLPDLAR